ncbi:glycosyltransferase [Methylobacterium haplocladii]|uniref:Polysaccharide biosynthesis protein n=1 Tax=Methylobacterium haplocladii TaxID=1176176 RepID=A0A512ISU9_9HYPH|nr:glycosyltransferase [Methylobacterium haplocladii]GEP00785.1 polysaccharide biosynthesis protein [Methylobacterium haplocladii]GJD83120.1 D-inositol-3-phosphate glycosyltransferase [Methylobacterium haplocladii]GLS59520.1 polysaccharide biosynthesis protein [Methylobacterium haplocladii]
MHVVILAEFAVASGGAEKVAVESARGLAEAGIAVSFIQAIDGPADALLDHPRIHRIGLGLDDVWSLPAWKGAVTGIWHAEAARRLATTLDALPVTPNCIHLHQWTRALSPAVLPVLLARGVPVALTLHDYFLACPNGLYYRFDQAEPCTLKPLSASCVTAACDPKSRLHKLVRVARSAAMRTAIGAGRLDVIHVCDASVGRAGALLAGFDLRHHRLDNPVRTPKGPPADPAKGDAIAYVGRLTREKGADLVADAARQAGIPALFIGAGPLEARLRATPGVEVLGWRSPAEVEAILRSRARAVCAPSRWYETGPLTIYEALAAGIPAIASTHSGASEKVEDGVSGFAVAPDVAALAAAFARITDDEMVQRTGQAAHERYWAAPMTLTAHAAGLIRIYETMMRGIAPKLSGAASDPAFNLAAGCQRAETNLSLR